MPLLDLIAWILCYYFGDGSSFHYQIIFVDDLKHLKIIISSVIS